MEEQQVVVYMCSVNLVSMGSNGSQKIAQASEVKITSFGMHVFRTPASIIASSPGAVTIITPVLSCADVFSETIPCSLYVKDILTIKDLS